MRREKELKQQAVARRDVAVDGDGDVVMGETESEMIIPRTTMSIPFNVGGAVHIPVVPLVTLAIDGQRTPKQTDSNGEVDRAKIDIANARDEGDFFGIVSQSNNSGDGTMRQWAKNVSYETGISGPEEKKRSLDSQQQQQRIRAESLGSSPIIPISASASAGTSEASSDESSFGFRRGNVVDNPCGSVPASSRTNPYGSATSSLGTSIRSSSNSFNKSLPRVSGGLGASPLAPKSASMPQQSEEHRLRTWSAPSAGVRPTVAFGGRPMFAPTTVAALGSGSGSGAKGIGSSPLSALSTAWLGEDHAIDNSPGIMMASENAHDTPAQIPPPHARSMSPSADDDSMITDDISNVGDHRERSTSGGNSNPGSARSSFSRHDRARPIVTQQSNFEPPPSGPTSLVTSNREKSSLAGGLESVASFNAHGRTTVDYKEPRALHSDISPEALSVYEEPLWEVVQDMREQRMSLCQSLRQYVFVHAAVIEGALMIVDEERKRDSEGDDHMPEDHEKVSHDKSSRYRGSESPRRSRYSSTTSQSRPSPHLLQIYSNASHSSSSISLSTGKRLASPTELLKEDKRGDISLSKRPSIKRKQTSTADARVVFPHQAGGTIASYPP